MGRPVLALLLLSLAAPPVAAFTAENGQRVTPAGPGAFAVGWRGRSGAPDFWCAAGDYVLHALNRPPATRVYRLDAPPRPCGAAIRFGFDPARAAPTGLLRLQGGRGLTAAYARRFCERDR